MRQHRKKAARKNLLTMASRTYRPPPVRAKNNNTSIRNGILLFVNVSIETVVCSAPCLLMRHRATHWSVSKNHFTFLYVHIAPSPTFFFSSSAKQRSVCTTFFFAAPQHEEMVLCRNKTTQSYQCISQTIAAFASYLTAEKKHWKEYENKSIQWMNKTYTE